MSGTSTGTPFISEHPSSLTPLGYQQIVGLVASTALTVPATANYAIITTENQNVRWRDDGVAPTAAVGYPLLVGQELTYAGDLSLPHFIQTAATATLDISYYKQA